MASVIRYMAKSKGKRVRRVGRPTRKELGLEPMQSVFTRVEKSVIDSIVAEFGTVNAGLRALAKTIKKAG